MITARKSYVPGKLWPRWLDIIGLAGARRYALRLDVHGGAWYTEANALIAAQKRGRSCGPPRQEGHAGRSIS
jgi:hypothetical protein